MINDSTRNKWFIKCLIISSIVACANIFFYSNKIVSLIITVLEMICLIALVCYGRIIEYLVCYLIFVCNCIEFAAFVGGSAVYNIKCFKLLGVNLCVWALLPVFVKLVLRPIRIGYIKSQYVVFYKYAKNLLLINIIAAVVGIILITFNDNRINSIPGYMTEYVGMGYTMLYLPLGIIACFTLICQTDTRDIWKIGVTLQAVLWAAIVQLIAALLFGIFGSYGSVAILASSIMYFVMPLGLLLSIDNKHTCFPKLNIILTIIGTLLALQYNSNGKVVILVILVAIFEFFHLLKSRSLVDKLVIVFLIAGVLGGIPIVLEKLQESLLFNSKMEQAISMLTFWRKGWLANMAHSPKMRVAELLNVFIEYLNKPWLIISGKGYLGSIRDYMNMFGTQITSPGAFSSAEWSAGVFYNLHEFSITLIEFGLLGVLYNIGLIKISFKKYSDNIWLLFGCIWFVLLYGYSFTLSTFGMVALFYGLCIRTHHE